MPTVDGVRSDQLPAATPHVTADLPEPGEAAAHRALDRFVASRLDDYATTRNDPGADATSRLSPYLKWGCLHPRQLLRRLDGRKPVPRHVRQGAGVARLLRRRPRRVARVGLALVEPADGRHARRRGTRAEERFEAWREGRTGFPIVDAGMRQLVAEGWMHNRVRMITASFLVKDLHVDWTRGARFFLQHLVDGDLSSNNHGWQWVAGTAPMRRPTSGSSTRRRRARSSTPTATYVRRWVPELADLAGSAVHEPWAAPDGPPPGYPPPIVDHAAEREESLSRYADLRR